MNTIFDDLFVLELANNHWGQLDRGLRIVNDFTDVVRANQVRAAIKLQFRDVDTFVHPEHRHRQDVRYIKKTVATRMDWSDQLAMVRAVRDAGMVTMVTPFDEESVRRCVEFDVDVLKIASSDIRDTSLLRAVAATGKPVAASSGGASLQHLDALVNFFTKRGTAFALNHCVSLYPSADSDLELNQVDFLRNRYPGITVGLSTHEHNDWSSSIMIAYAKGARTFERHIDIDLDGVPVSPYCTLPEQADTWFKAFKKAQEMCGGQGDGRRAVPPGERRYLDALVRGVYARRSLPAGHVLTERDVFFAVPLLAGQLSVREFSGGEMLTAPVRAHGQVQLAQVEASYSDDADLARLVADRGLGVPEAATAVPCQGSGTSASRARVARLDGAVS